MSNGFLTVAIQHASKRLQAAAHLSNRTRKSSNTRIDLPNCDCDMRLMRHVLYLYAPVSMHAYLLLLELAAGHVE